MRSEALLLYFTLLHFAGAGFPEDSEPISISHGNYTKQYPVFVGHKPGRNTTQRHRLDIQMIMIMNRTLYIAARLNGMEEQHYKFDLTVVVQELDRYPFQTDVKNTNTPPLRNTGSAGDHICDCPESNIMPPKQMDTLESFGDEFSGMARCPYDAKHANIALFAVHDYCCRPSLTRGTCISWDLGERDGKLYSATVTDFLAIDSVIYRSLGESPTLRTVKHDSKWLKEPYFVQAVDYGDYIYFFFREIAVEYNTMGKVVFPRVAQVCKNDMGGSQRVLEKQWTSFLKARLNCSVPGDSHFYFNILQAVTDVIHINGRDVVLATFSTPYNRCAQLTNGCSLKRCRCFKHQLVTSRGAFIPGSAVCAYDMLDIASVFTGRFKEQKSPDSTWTPVPDERVPKPRPGCCAGSSSLEKYATSNEFPDDTLNFIKTHPLMDEAVPSIFNRPWFLRTMVRYRLTKIAVDTAAGPYQNHTVVFLGSEKGIILKFLAKIGNSGFLNDSLFLEEMSVYNPEKLTFEQDIERGNTDGLGDCHNSFVALNGHSSSLLPSTTTSDSTAQEGYESREGMLDWKHLLDSPDSTDPLGAVSSHNHQDKKAWNLKRHAKEFWLLLQEVEDRKVDGEKKRTNRRVEVGKDEDIEIDR
ncbi:Semaphorin-6A [Saguinus oedipus]|uniref:Semaphorin-6A n=1 Tax=Saguinus oedipus TaxID=9490 RepID=A0ABQ9W9P6_SAGOE|nr:Semaphorin-6A [Saguinus oedipus]